MTQRLYNFHVSQSNSPTKTKYITTVVILIAVIVGLYILSRFNYPLFHSLADGATVFIAIGVFVVVWNRRHLLDNYFYLFVGVAFLFFAFWDALHLLGNRGMGVFPQYGNLGPTLYIVSRYFLSFSLVIAPLFIKRKLNTTVTFAAYALVTVILLLSIFYWQNFPVTYIEGVGLTSFKVISDYLICFLLAGAAGLLFINRRALDAKVFRFFILAIVFFIATGLAFTLYTDPFGVTNAVGHFFQITSFYLVYVALLETILMKPQDILYRNLKQSEKNALQLNADLGTVNIRLKEEITERKKVEGDLRQSEEQYRLLFSANPNPMFVFDEKTLCFLAVNDVAAHHYGWSREEFLAMTVLDIRLPEEHARAIETIRQHQGLYGARVGIVRHLGKNGILMEMEVTASSITFDGRPARLCLMNDVTERNRAEAALRESEQRLTGILESMPDAFVSFDVNLRYTYVNSNAELLQNASREDLIGKDVRILYPDAESYKTISQYEQVIRTKKPVTLTSYHAGFARWVEIRVFPTPDGVSVFYKDVSESKKAEEALHVYAQQLENANKELEAFSYSVSHDLRAPLRTMDGFSEAVLEEFGDKLEEAGKDYLNRIRTASQTMSHLIDDILKLSRISRAEMHRDKVNLSNLARSIIEEMQRNHPERQVEIIIAPDLMVNGDLALLRIALNNLLENAWKYTARCSITQIEVGVRTENGSQIYFVRDNGVGFDMRYSDKLFHPFQRLHSSKDYPGTGIGLATVQRVIHRHGGRIWAESVVEKGTTFYFTLGQVDLDI